MKGYDWSSGMITYREVTLATLVMLHIKGQIVSLDRELHWYFLESTKDLLRLRDVKIS